MKILIITAKYPPQRCGIGNYTSFLLDHLIKNKCEVKIITSGQRKKSNNIYNLIIDSNFLDICIHTGSIHYLILNDQYFSNNILHINKN